MKKILVYLGVVTIALTLLSGCSTPSNCVYVGSGTTLGFDVSQSPATQSPQATLAYKRIELAVVPVTTNGVTPDVIMDFSFKTSIFTSAGGIYSRVAIGSNATTQIPAALMMAKDRTGGIGSLTNIPNLFPLLISPKSNK
jgi:hypothetical protein